MGIQWIPPIQRLAASLKLISGKQIPWITTCDPMDSFMRHKSG